MGFGVWGLGLKGCRGLGFRGMGLGFRFRAWDRRKDLRRQGCYVWIWATRGRTLSLKPLRYQEDFLQLVALLLPVSSHVDGTLSPNSPQKP